MKYIYKVIPLFAAVFSLAQVGVNTTKPLAVLHIDAERNNDTNPTFNPSSPEVADDVVFTEEGKLGISTINPVTKLDLRNPNRANSILAVGHTNQTAAEAGEGAIRYSSDRSVLDKQYLEYSDGVTWRRLMGVEEKVIVRATKETVLEVPNRTSIVVNDWNIIYDTSNGRFDASKGVFKVPRDGNYTVSFSYGFDNMTINNLSQVEAILFSSSSDINSQNIGSVPVINNIKCVNPIPLGSSSTRSSAYCTGTIRLLKDNYLAFVIWGKWGTPDRAKTLADSRYNSLSIIEQ